MRAGSGFVLLFLFCLIVIFVPEGVLAQNNITTQDLEVLEELPVSQENNAVLAQTSEIQWLWGEVVSVDSQKNEITIKYLDYETDTEKEMKVSVDETVVYENVKSINDIKTDDIISVDYAFSPDGRYIAKNISIEKSENKPELQKKVTGEVENLTNAATSVTP